MWLFIFGATSFFTQTPAAIFIVTPLGSDVQAAPPQERYSAGANAFA